MLQWYSYNHRRRCFTKNWGGGGQKKVPRVNISNYYALNAVLEKVYYRTGAAPGIFTRGRIGGAD